MENSTHEPFLVNIGNEKSEIEFQKFDLFFSGSGNEVNDCQLSK